MVRSKECFKCKTVKPLDDFYKHQRMADGHLNKCKQCTKSDVALHREKNIERIREYDRERGKNKDRIAKSTEVTRAWRQEDSRRQRAHNAVARAIKNGTMERKPCVVCGNEKSEGHHEDYDRPLDVVWLCSACHKQRHKQMLEGS